MKKSVRITLSAAATAAALVLAACSGPEAADEAVDESDLSPEAVAALEIVTAHSNPVGDFEAPGPELSDLDSLAGGTVYYVPANGFIPLFKNIGAGLTEALGHFDISVEVCDGKANPSDIAGCLAQAVDAKADAVISGSIPDELATVAFESVRSAGIPLLYMQVAPEGPGEPNKVAYLTEDNVELQAWNANWVIADSNAAAEVLVVKITDTPATVIWADMGAIATYESACTECKVTVVEANTGELDKLPSLISSQLVSNPKITYVHAAFDVTVQSIIQGIQATGREDVTVVSKDGTLPVMQDLAAGRFIASEVGFNQEALAWYGADQVLRMMSGNDSVQAQEFPYRRLFTKDTVADLDLTPEGEASGSWYGGTDYKEGFLTLWGAAA